MDPDKMNNVTSSKKAHLPLSRINTIMKSSSDVDTVDKESVILMCKATEFFIKMLAQEGYRTANQGKKLDYKHLADVVHSEDKYTFLRDIMPKKITYLEYKKIMARKQGLLIDDSNDDTSSGSSEYEDDSSSLSEESIASC